MIIRAVFVVFLSLIYFGLAPNTFQKGGVDGFYNIMPLILACLMVWSFLYTYFVKITALIWILIILVSVLSLLFANYFCAHYVESKHGDKTWELWEEPNRLDANMLLFICLLFSAYFISMILIKSVKLLNRNAQ